MSDNSLSRKVGENEEQFLWRIGQAKDSGLIDLDWKEITDLMNKEFRSDESEYRSESAYRKLYQYARKFYESGAFKQYATEDDYIRELRNAKHELQMEKQKLSDERTELNRALREQARKESYIDLVSRQLQNVKPLEFDYTPRDYRSTDNDLICHITDLHAGINIDHWYNRFDMSVLRERLWKYLDQLFDIQKRHNSQDCYVVIGEILSGLIHHELRIENNENIVEQFIYVSSMLSEFLAEVSKRFESVYVYITPGNHSRVVANKEHSLRGENFDVLLPHYLKASLQNYHNVFIEDNKKDCDVAIFDVRGNHVFGVHGDKDETSNVVQRFTMIFGVKPDIVLMGHRHTNALTTVYDTKVIQSGCVSGSDNYCLDRRLKNRPEQTVSVVSEDGLVCIYDVKVD